MKKWHGLVKILEVQHLSKTGEVLWEARNLYNTFHTGGELYVLSCAFDNDGSLPVSTYYFGLDNRADIQVDDEIGDLSAEPVGSGYSRAAVSSENQFTMSVVDGVYRATSQIVTFTSTGSGWGPVSNLFLVTSSDNSGILLATSPLSEAISLSGGESVIMRMALALQDVS